MKLQNAILTVIILIVFDSGIFPQQTEYDRRFDLTICTTTRNAPAELLITDGSGNTFTGILKVDNEERPVFGWYTEKISEGGMFVYNTRGLSFYVKLDADFQHQQLFEALFNFDETIISGTYFYWGNEFVFYGIKSEQPDQPVDTIPDDEIFLADTSLPKIIPTGDISFNISSENPGPVIQIIPNPSTDKINIVSHVIDLEGCRAELFTIDGRLIRPFLLAKAGTSVSLTDLPKGIYVLKIYNKEQINVGTEKIIKN